MRTKRKYTTITIPSVLFENLEENIEGTSFSSVSDYATYILRENLMELKSKRSDKRERSAVVEKLRALGYA